MHRILKSLLNAVLVLGCVSAPVVRAQDQPPGAVIFEDVRIFNGTSDQLSAPSNVLTVDGVIKAISSAPMADPPNMAVQRIRAGGRTLMPGLIDSHWHTMLAAPSMTQLMEADLG
jgi:imidazolonepropionase-like amidohydrolase